MLKKTWIIAAVSVVGFAGCIETDAERAMVGAGIGCAANEILRDGRCVDGALIGAVGGALFDDVTGR